MRSTYGASCQSNKMEVRRAKDGLCGYIVIILYIPHFCKGSANKPSLLSLNPVEQERDIEISYYFCGKHLEDGGMMQSRNAEYIFHLQL